MPVLTPPPEMTLDQRIAMTASARDADAILKVAGAGEVVVDPSGERVQIMHNGLKMVADGYCGAWMTRLIQLCRGHHEPQEELAFHTLLQRLSDRAVMVELGANWAYYTCWFLKDRPDRRGFVVEPDPAGFALAGRNLALNGLVADLTRGYIGTAYAALQAGHPIPAPRLSLANFFAARGLDHVDLLHCDAQGAEAELLDEAGDLFRAGRIGWLMLSTHGAPITGDPLTHQKCLAQLADLGAHIALEHDVHESFSGDGLIVARFPAAREEVVFPPISRNRYSTSYWPNPLYALAEHTEAPVLDASAQQAAATFGADKGPIHSVGVWLELSEATAIGAAGERILAPADTVMLPYLHQHGRWQTDALDLALAHLDRDAAYAVVDIGANIGMAARQYLEAFPGARACLCVEPDARNFEALQYNLRKYADRDLRFYPFALGASDGVATFYRDADNIGNFSLAADAMRNRKFEAGSAPTVDARVWAQQTLSGFNRLILKTDTQGLDETIVSRIPLSIWLKVAFASIEIWRIQKPAFDERLFRNVALSFPNWSFRGALNCPVDDILDYAHGSDWMFHDLYLWR